MTPVTVSSISALSVVPWAVYVLDCNPKDASIATGTRSASPCAALQAECGLGTAARDAGAWRGPRRQVFVASSSLPTTSSPGGGGPRTVIDSSTAAPEGGGGGARTRREADAFLLRLLPAVVAGEDESPTIAAVLPLGCCCGQRGGRGENSPLESRYLGRYPPNPSCMEPTVPLRKSVLRSGWEREVASGW